MSTEANKEIVRRWNEEFFNQRQVDAIDRFLHPNYVGHPGGSPGTMDFAAAKEEFTKGLESNATSDAQLRIDDLIAEGDKVAFRWSVHQGGRAVWSGISIHRIEDDKIIEDWYHSTEAAEA